MKKCLNCGNDVRPSVVKCNHCGRNPNEAPEEAPAGTEAAAAAGAGTAVAPGSGTADAGATGEGAATPRPDAVSAPPASVAFTLPGQGAPSEAPAEPAEPAEAPPAPSASSAPPASAAGPAPADDSQDWGPPAGSTPQDVATYWAVKRQQAPMGAAQAQESFRANSGGGLGMASAVCALLGGALSVVGGLQQWATPTVSGPAGKVGITFTSTGGGGKTVAIVGGLGILSAILWFAAGRDTKRLRLEVLWGLVVAGIAAYNLYSMTDQLVGSLVDSLKTFGVTEAVARGQITGWVDAGYLGVSAQPGIYLALAGGLLLILAGVLAFFAKTGPKAEAWSAPPGRGL